MLRSTRAACAIGVRYAGPLFLAQLPASANVLATSSWTWAPVAGAAIAGVVALLGILANLAAARRDRRAELYAEAYKAALAMVEMVYRARRAGPDNLRAVYDHFHRIHEDINFHQGWIETESQEMGRAYRRLILRVRGATKDSITDAWETLRRSGAEDDIWFRRPRGRHPDVADAKDDFLKDVADHLSWSWKRRQGLRTRYADDEWRRIRGHLPQPSGGTFFDPPPP